jgi:hypothetical protein
MSASTVTGGLQAVLPGRMAIAGNPGERCAVCESCKAIICKVYAKLLILAVGT